MGPTSSFGIEPGLGKPPAAGPREPVRVVYTCYGGTHSSPVAAAIHLGRLPRDRVPSSGELLAVPGFDRAEGDCRGRLVPVGADRWGNPVYVLPRGALSLMVVHRLLSGALAMAGRDDMPVLLVDTLACLNWPMRVGGFLSRRLHLVPAGRPLVTWGTRRAYHCLVGLVEQVEAVLAGQMPGTTARQGESLSERDLRPDTQRLTWPDRG